MKFTKLIAGTVAMIAVAGLSMVSANAAQFAKFSQQITGDSPFIVNNTGTGETFTANTPVFFTYGAPNGTGTLNTNIAGNLSFSTAASTFATTASFGGATQINQPVGAVDLTFTSSSPINGMTNLLTVHATGGIISGLEDAAPTLTLANVTFTSDFLNFAATTNRSGSLSFTFDTFEIDPDGYLMSTVGSGQGGFNSTPLPTIPSTGTPEPATTAALGIGMLGVGALMFRARKRSTLSVTA